MANMQKDPVRIERILPNFKDYREMWRQAVGEFKQQQREQTGVQGHGFAAVG
jgi:flagellin-specific chaperone FliS